MNIAVLIEGRNFYAGQKRWASDHEIDFVKLRNVILTQTSNGTIHVANYYMGVDQNNQLSDDAQYRIAASIKQLEVAGFCVKTYPLRVRAHTCTRCDAAVDEIVEKQVDAAIAIDVMKLLDARKTDLFVLVTSDTDQLPTVQEIRATGSRVVLVVWHGSALSPQLAANVDGVISLDDYRAAFLLPRNDGVTAMIRELGKAEKQFNGGYVGTNYFLANWKAPDLPRTAIGRETILKDLIARGIIEQYTTDSGQSAIQLAQRVSTPKAVRTN